MEQILQWQFDYDNHDIWLYITEMPQMYHCLILIYNVDKHVISVIIIDGDKKNQQQIEGINLF